MLAPVLTRFSCGGSAVGLVDGVARPVACCSSAPVRIGVDVVCVWAESAVDYWCRITVVDDGCIIGVWSSWCGCCGMLRDWVLKTVVG